MRSRAKLPVRAPGEMTTLLNVPELGAIPRVNKRSISGRFTPLLAAGSEDHVELITFEQQLSNVSESFRNTLASIVLPGPAKAPQVLVVTSAGAMEGKTTVASNLGIALAEIGRRVLLVDADMRSPRLQKVFDVPNTWGLIDLLRDESVIANLPDSALAKPTRIQRLSLLPSGPPSKEFHRLLHSGASVALLNRLRQSFDHIIIDAPPLLYFADARVLGHHADGAVLVVRANRTARNLVLQAMQRLQADGIPLFGAILNDWDPQVTGYGYGYGYGYHDLNKYANHYERSAN
jgi:receptor protein-tyrosine kinase